MPQAAIPIAASIAGSVASSAISNAMAPDASSANIPEGARVAPPIQLTGGGLSIVPNPAFAGRGFTMSRSPEAQSALDAIIAQAKATGGQIGDLLPLVAPGFGKLTQSRVQAVRDAASRSIGDLRENLSRRRVLGSSFAQDTLARAGNEFGKTEADVRAQSFLEELDLTNKLIQQRGAVLSSAAEKQLSQLNLEFGEASNLINGTQQVLTSNANALAQLAIANAQGAGQFAAPTAKAVGSGVSQLVGSGLTDLFSGGGGGGITLNSANAFGESGTFGNYGAGGFGAGL